MKAKLIKTEQGYYLHTGRIDGIHLACYPHTIDKQKLSIKNCQAIERGYDLDGLYEIHKDSVFSKMSRQSFVSKDDFKAGFQKALEIIGDKKFTEQDIVNAFEAGRHRGHDNVNYLDTGSKTCSEYLQSLQQNEWEVEIEMTLAPKYYGYVPKLDADGCLILKRV